MGTRDVGPDESRLEVDLFEADAWRAIARPLLRLLGIAVLCLLVLWLL